MVTQIRKRDAVAAALPIRLFRALSDPNRIALVAWLMAWIGGIVGDIGTGLQNEAVQDVGIVSRLILPTDGLWRGAINAMEPDVVLAQLRSAGVFARANPFAALDPPPVAFLLWVAVWFSLTLFLSIWSFRTREI